MLFNRLDHLYILNLYTELEDICTENVQCSMFNPHSYCKSSGEASKCACVTGYRNDGGTCTQYGKNIETVHRGLNYVFDLLNRSLYATLVTEQEIELIEFEIIIKSS